VLGSLDSLGDGQRAIRINLAFKAIHKGATAGFGVPLAGRMESVRSNARAE
jgi:hypothetical protein